MRAQMLEVMVEVMQPMQLLRTGMKRFKRPWTVQNWTLLK